MRSAIELSDGGLRRVANWPLWLGEVGKEHSGLVLAIQVSLTSHLRRA